MSPTLRMAGICCQQLQNEATALYDIVQVVPLYPRSASTAAPGGSPACDNAHPARAARRHKSHLEHIRVSRRPDHRGVPHRRGASPPARLQEPLRDIALLTPPRPLTHLAVTWTWTPSACLLTGPLSHPPSHPYSVRDPPKGRPIAAPPAPPGAQRPQYQPIGAYDQPMEDLHQPSVGDLPGNTTESERCRPTAASMQYPPSVIVRRAAPT